METSRAASLLRFLLVTFNLAFWFSGLMFLVAGIWMDIELMKYSETCAAFSKLSILLLIFTGIMILCLGSIGCCCTLKTEPTLFYWYHGLMAVIFILEIAVVITVFTCKGCLNMSHLDDYRETLNRTQNLPNVELLSLHYNDFDTSQSKYNCCGIANYDDWTKLSEPLSIPDSCCKTSGCNTNDKTALFDEGCYHKVHRLMAYNMSFIGIVSIVVSILPVIGHLITRFYGAVLERSNYERI